MSDFYMCINLPIKTEYYILLKKIQISEKDEPQSQFFQLTNTNILICFT